MLAKVPVCHHETMEWLFETPTKRIDEMLETKASFSEKVLNYCKQKELPLLEGLTSYLQVMGIETEDAPGLLTNELKAMLHKEAIELNLFKPTGEKVKFDE